MDIMVDVACVHGELQRAGVCVPPSAEVIQPWIVEGYTIDETVSGLLDGQPVPVTSRIVFDGTQARAK